MYVKYFIFKFNYPKNIVSVRLKCHTFVTIVPTIKKIIITLRFFVKPISLYDIGMNKKYKN